MLGAKDYFKFLEKYDLHIENEKLVEHLKEFKGRKWKSFIDKSNSHLASEEAIDLIKRVLVYDFVRMLR